jgi:hypothetical protein
MTKETRELVRLLRSAANVAFAHGNVQDLSILLNCATAALIDTDNKLYPEQASNYMDELGWAGSVADILKIRPWEKLDDQ